MAEGDDATDDSMAEGDDATDDSMAEGDDAAEGDASAESAYDWSDVNRRKAVSMTIDRQAITDAIFLGSRSPADDWWPSTIPGYRGGDWCPNIQYNPEEAKKLWDEAGGDAGPITLWFNTGGGHEDWMEAVANQLKENLGVADVQFQALEFADLLDKLDADEVGGPFRSGWIMDYPSPGNFLGPLYATTGSANNSGFSNPDFDAAVAAGDALSLEDSIADYQAADDILCENVPVSPMFFSQHQTAWSTNVNNVQWDAFEHLRLDQLEDVDGDGQVSQFITEPQNGLFGQMTNETGGSHVVHALFTGLVTLGDDGNVSYDEAMAESIETTDDGTTWTIKLKDGWTFHDGTPVTSKSFADAWNWAALGSNAAENQYFISLLGIKGFAEMNPEEGADAGDVPTEMTGLTTPDDLTLQLELEAPFPQLPLVLLYSSFNPLPESFFADPEALGENPIGNGPFMMDGTWEHDVQIATKAYDGYAGVKPSIAGMTYKIYNDEATAYNDVRAGNLDIIYVIPTAELANFTTEFDGRYSDDPSSAFNYLGFPIHDA